MRAAGALAAAAFGVALLGAPATAQVAIDPEGATSITASGFDVAPEVEGLIVRYSPGYAPVTAQGEVTGAEALPDLALEAGRDVGFGLRTIELPTPMSVVAAEAAARALSASPAVVSATPNYRVRIVDEDLNGDDAAGAPVAVDPATTQAKPPWGLDRIDQRVGLDESYHYDTTGAGVTVYVIDTGLRTSHQEFTGRVLPGASTVADGRGVQDCEGHGTHVAGTIAGTTYGVAKGAKIVPVRVGDCEGYMWWDQVLWSLDWVIAHHSYSTPAVLNMSIGLPLWDEFDAAVERAVADNITVVASAGNKAKDACSQTPARVPSAITVAAATYPDGKASFSNYGPCTDIYAPGTGTVSASHASDTGTATMSGTSMSAPHVAGAAARVLWLAPTMTPAQVWQRLSRQATAVNFQPAMPDDAKKLLHVPPPPVTPAPSVFVPIDPVRVLDTRLSQGGAGPLAVGESRVASVANQTAQQGGALNVVPPGVVAVAYNITVPAGGWSGHLRVMPADVPLTSASAVNFRAAATIANGLVTRVDGQRRVKVYNAAGGPTEAIIDVVGYFLPAASTPNGGRFTAVTPVRVYDTGATPLAAGATRTVSVANQVPGDGGAANVVPVGATALAYNITVVRPDGAGHLRVFPGDKASSGASSINWTSAGDVVANGLQVRLAADRTIRVFNAAGVPVRFLIDVLGYFRPGAGAYFYATDPVRAYDSRSPLPTPGPLATGLDQIPRTVTMAHGRDADGYVETFEVVPLNATAVAYNLTVTATLAAGHLRMYPSSATLVGASAINWPGAGYTRANGSIVAVPPNLRVSVFNGSTAGTHAIVDTLGYYK